MSNTLQSKIRKEKDVAVFLTSIGVEYIGKKLYQTEQLLKKLASSSSEIFDSINANIVS